jgi:small-conductance mechanosensitive channel
VAGRITHIRARSTTVVTNDNITLIVPNSVFVEHTVTEVRSQKNPELKPKRLFPDE